MVSNRAWLVFFYIGTIAAECYFNDRVLSQSVGGRDYSAFQPSSWYSLDKDAEGDHVLEYVVKGRATSRAKAAILEVMDDIRRNVKCVKIAAVPVGTSFDKSKVITIDIAKACTDINGASGDATPNREVLMYSTLCSTRVANDEVIWKGVLLHELFHVLGLQHMHSRWDRDRYITVITGNIQADRLSQYAKCFDCTVYGPYECNSLMHYQQGGWSKRPGLPTMSSARCSTFGGFVATRNDWDAVNNKLECGVIVNRRRGSRTLGWFRGRRWNRNGQRSIKRRG